MNETITFTIKSYRDNDGRSHDKFIVTDRFSNIMFERVYMPDNRGVSRYFEDYYSHVSGASHVSTSTDYNTTETGY